MNHFFTTLLALCIAAPAFAQPIITSDIQPLPGDECHYLFNPDGFNYGLGPDQYWDLTGIPFTPTSSWIFVLPDTTPGFTYYPASDLALLAGFGYEYYDMTPDAWTVVGLYLNADDHAVFSDPYVAMPFPWTYGTEWEDPYAYELFGEFEQDTLRWQASTYGTVRLPGGHELEVVGMVELEVDVDTFSGTTYYDEDVYLYSPGIRCRVAAFGRSWSFNPAWPSGDTISYVRALDDAAIGMAENAVSSELELWPVPASGTLNVHWAGAPHNAAAQVFDATGRLQFTTTLRSSGSDVSLDVSTLAPGHYILHVNDAERTLVRPFIVE